MIVMDYLEELTTRRGYCQRQLLPPTNMVQILYINFVKNQCLTERRIEFWKIFKNKFVKIVNKFYFNFH